MRNRRKSNGFVSGGWSNLNPLHVYPPITNGKDSRISVGRKSIAAGPNVIETSTNPSLRDSKMHILNNDLDYEGQQENNELLVITKFDEI